MKISCGEVHLAAIAPSSPIGSPRQGKAGCEALISRRRGGTGKRGGGANNDLVKFIVYACLLVTRPG